MSFQYIGKSVERIDIRSKVTGATRYADDITMQGMLYGALLRSEYAHAFIKHIDTAQAKSIPGVVDVVTANDMLPNVPLFGSVTSDQPILASNKVRYHGEPIAVVLATDKATAALAVKQIKVDYEELPHVCTVEEALKADAPVIHAEMDLSSNVHSTLNYGWGDVDKGKSCCANIITNEYEFPMIHQSMIEPYCVIAYPEGEGVVIKSPIQHPFILQRVVAAALGMSISQVRIVPTNLGGGFGGKGYAKYEPLAAYLAIRTGQPVKLAFTMEDDFYTARRLSAHVNITTGFDTDGHIVFQDIIADYLIGAYADCSPRVVAKAAYLGCCGPYRTPNAKMVAKVIYSNTVPSTAMRGFGMPQIVWAIESQMNEASRLLGIDTLEIRLRNLPDKGDILVPKDSPVDGEWKQGLKLAAELVGWKNEKQPNTGRGIAIGIKNPIPCSVSNAIVKIHADASVTVAVGTTEMGQGARTVMSQIAAELLGVPIKRINVIMGDTAAVPFDFCTAASRSTVSMGNAVTFACQDIINQFTYMACELNLIEKGENVKFNGGLVRQNGQVIPYSDLMHKYFGFTQEEVFAKGTFRGEKDEESILGGLTDFWEIIFSAAEVKVDTETGKIQVTKLVGVGDPGKVINPLQAKGQEEGGAIMAMGHTLMEQMIYGTDGRLKNGGPLDYRIPTAMDIPLEMKCAFIENQDGAGPFGSKGMGESGVISPAPAIADAVCDAIGIKIKSLPLTPEKVWKAIQDQKQ